MVNMDPQQSPFMDRRKYFRLTDMLIIRCARLSMPPNPVPVETHWLASTVDISEGGVLLRSPERLRLGEGVEILFEFEKNAPPVRIAGNVVRYHAVMYDKIFYVPIAFAKMDAATQDKLQAYIARATAKR